MVEARRVQPGEDLRYLDGPWNNAACKGYAMMAMEQEGLDAEIVKKVLSRMEWCFDSTTVREAESYYYNGGKQK